MKKISQLLISLSLLLSLGSCGIVEFDEVLLESADMKLNLTTAYLMVGDTLDLKPVFTPDSVKVGDVYLYTSNDTVLIKEGNRLIANMEGSSTVTAVSMLYQKSDSCHVFVMPRWEFDYHDYPHSTVVYADVELPDREFDPSTMTLSAWVADEIRGIGVVRYVKGTRYIEMRVYGLEDKLDISNPDKISFRLYDPKTFTLYIFPQRLDYDGETHGVPGNLFKLSLKK